ncbi:MAG TPA: outer membrane protein assembly factor BamA [Gemmataceae bacterium]|jgi:outer membrane protein assembly complex protein YaeT|nr:outer membrane protein assembly factor BamA [Gemmataceae bacterium]
MNAMDRGLVRFALVGGGLLLAIGLGFAQVPSEPLVAEVIPVGNKLVSREKILNQMRTKPGNIFRLATLEEDQRTLYQSGAFNDVRMRTQVGPDGRITVFVDVAEVPSLIKEIKYEGNRALKEDELNKLTGLRMGMPMNATSNRLACQKILQKYQDDGHLFASVNLKEGGQLGDTRVVFEITEGPVVRVQKTVMVGQGSWVSSARLRSQILTSRTILGIGGKFNSKMVDEDVNILTNYFRNLGYLNVRVDPEYIPCRNESRVNIVYHISEGTQYHVGNIEITGNKSQSDDQLIKLTAIKPGGLYDRNVINADMNNIRDKYGFRGQLVTVEERHFETDTPGITNIQYVVQERPPAMVGDINIIGNDRTQDRIILRNLGFYPGQVLTWPDIRAAEARLGNLGIFEVDQEKGIRPTIVIRDQDSDNPYKTIDINVNETSTGIFMLGLGVNSDAGLNGQIVLNERNFDILRFPRSLDDLLSGNAFRGAGQEFRLEAMPGTTFQRYTASFREPSLFDSPFSLALSGYYYQRGFLEYTESRIGERTTVGRQFTRMWSASETIRVEGVNLYNIPGGAPPAISDFAGWSFLTGFRTSIVRDARDSYLRPTTGSQLEVAFEQVVGSYIFPVGTIDFTKYFTTFARRDGSGKQVLAFRTMVGWSGDDTPVFERFYAGGFRSIRGFAYRGVGPFVGGFNEGGNFTLLNSAEYQVPILANDKLWGVVFADGGTVEPKIGITNYRVSIGTGLRIVTPLTGPVPIALDFAYPVVKAPGDIKQIFSFYVGFGL